MSSDYFNVYAVREEGPAAIDNFGFYVLSDNSLQAPPNVSSATYDSLAREEEFWLSRICCYLRLSLEFQQYVTQSNDNSNNEINNDNSRRVLAIRATLLQAQKRIIWQMRRRLRLFGGTPHITFRRLLWGFFTGALRRPAPVVAAHNKIYKSLCDNSPDSLTFDVISRDLSRTFPTHCLFVGPSAIGQYELQRLLCAFSQIDSEVGYCQGMAFVAAQLLLHAPEPEAFAMLVQLCHSKLFRLREMYLPGFPLLQKLLTFLRDVMQRLLPQLHRHFKEVGVDVVCFASQWFLTLYTYQFSIEFSARLWDLFLAEGWRIILQAAIAILQTEQERLLKLDMEEILLCLKECHEGKSTDEMLRRVCSVPLSEEEFTSMLLSEGVVMGER